MCYRRLLAVPSCRLLENLTLHRLLSSTGDRQSTGHVPLLLVQRRLLIRRLLTAVMLLRG